jgi:CheY-like chemotaxis protein
VIKVFYVDDNDDHAYMLKMRLDLLDEFEVVVAEDGEKGCAAAVTEKPDFILMDLDLPVIDGREATRRLKANPQTRQINMAGNDGGLSAEVAASRFMDE